jgi:hypothetical protein
MLWHMLFGSSHVNCHVNQGEAACKVAHADVFCLLSEVVGVLGQGVWMVLQASSKLCCACSLSFC